MGRNGVTLRDVADAAGVSMMTVSKALRSKPGVSDATRETVLRKADELGYSLNASASILKSGRSGIIQIIVNEYNIPFYAKLIDALSKAVSERGMTPFLLQTGYSAQHAQSALANTVTAGALADGAIIHASSLNGQLVNDIRNGKPALLIDSLEAQPLVTSIAFPNETGARAAVQHLAERGCRRIGIVGLPFLSNEEFLRDPSPRKLRLRGAKTALQELGLPYDETMMFPLEGMTEERGIAVGHRIADEDLDFDGLFCFNDSVAIGVIRGLADRGLSVPDDIRVIGFDGVREGQFTVPSLSTISVDMDQLARLAVDEIVRQIEQGNNRGPATMTTVGFTLIERESTR